MSCIEQIKRRKFGTENSRRAHDHKEVMVIAIVANVVEQPLLEYWRVKSTSSNKYALVHAP